MKSVVRIAIGVVVMVIGWAFWPEAADPVYLKSHTTDQTANSASPTTVPKSLFVGQTSTSPPVEQSAQTCPSAEQLGTSLQQLQQQRVSLTNQLIDLHIKLGVKTPETLQILQAVGGDLEVFQFRQSVDKDNFSRFKNPLKPVFIDKKYEVSVRAAIANQDYNEVLQIIAQVPFEERRRLSRDREQSLLGWIIVANPQIPFAVIQKFIDSGIQPFLADLAAFTALDLPLPLIDMVQQHYKGDLQQQWQDNFRAYNLTLLAAETASTELFDYWRALGIPAKLEAQAPNAFDLIPLPNSEQQLQQQLSKIRTLLATSVLPRAADARGKWLLLLPEQESQQLSELLKQQPDLQFDKDGPDATQLLALQKLQLDFNLLLKQVAACPKSQQWQVALTTPRDLPDRWYLDSLQIQQQSSQDFIDISKQEIKYLNQWNELFEKRDWRGMQKLTPFSYQMTEEEANVHLLLLMTFVKASHEDLQFQLNNINKLSIEQAKEFAEVASPAQRELFKAAGFELPL